MRPSLVDHAADPVRLQGLVLAIPHTSKPHVAGLGISDLVVLLV